MSNQPKIYKYKDLSGLAARLRGDLVELYREGFPDCLPVSDKQGSLRLKSVYGDMYRVFSDPRC